MISKEELEKDFEFKKQALTELYLGFQKGLKELQDEQNQLLEELKKSDQ